MPKNYPGLNEEEIEEMREAFNLFDTDGSGDPHPELVSLVTLV
jgi:Ca2+-binding EF-hand superfamily protein